MNSVNSKSTSTRGINSPENITLQRQRSINNFNLERNLRKSDSLNNKVVDRKTITPSLNIASSQTFMKPINDSKGFMRPNRYLVEISAPKGLRGFATRNEDGSVPSDESQYDLFKIGLLCFSVSLPQKTLQTYEHKQLGVPYKVPHSITYDPLSITFYCDGDMEVRRFFDAWHRFIIDDKTASLNFYDDYVSEIKISMIDVEGYTRYMMKFLEIYPVSISNIDLSYATNNSLMMMTVSFSYKRFIEET